MATIVLNDMFFYANHGDSPEERKVGGKFKVNCQFDYNIKQAAQKDSIEFAVDYSKVYQIIDTQIHIPCTLIETVAHNILKNISDYFDSLSKTFQISNLKVEVYKQNPPIYGSFIGQSGVVVSQNDL